MKPTWRGNNGELNRTSALVANLFHPAHAKHKFASSDRLVDDGLVDELCQREHLANTVESAYHRTGLMEQRRPMMKAWAAHISPH